MSKNYIRGEDAEWAAIFSNNLRFISRSKGCSAAALSRALGLSNYQMRKIMQGEIRPSNEQVLKIAETLKCDASELTDDTYAPWNFGVDIDED